jgi:hypothetical protein
VVSGCQAFVLTICFTLAIAAEQGPDNFKVLSVAQLISTARYQCARLFVLVNIADLKR